MKLAIEHTATYRYESPIAHSIQKLRLTPRSDGRQRIIDWELDLPGSADGQLDAYGNFTHLLRLEKPQQEIRIHVHGLVETLDDAGLDDTLAAEAISPLVFLRTTALTTMSERMREFSAPFVVDIQANRVTGLQRLMAAIASQQREVPVTELAASAADAFEQGLGQAHDHAHVFLAMCRHMRIPARYVSGYLFSSTPESKAIASHAWAEAWIPDSGWLGFDVARQQVIGCHHLKLAVGMDYLDACPIRGLRIGVQETHTLAFEVLQMEQ